jgi:hypothetical protein
MAYFPIIGSACPLAPSFPPNAATTRNGATLYGGPGNLGYDVIARLAGCTVVTAQAMFGDFLKMEATVAGQVKTGFLHKSYVFTVPANLPVLSLEQVPWQNEDLVNRFALHPDVVYGQSDIMVDNSTHDSYNDDVPLCLTLAS